MSMYQYLEREQEREREAHWQESDPSNGWTQEELEAELQAQSEWQIYRWITGCSKHLWTSWEVL